MISEDPKRVKHNLVSSLWKKNELYWYFTIFFFHISGEYIARLGTNEAPAAKILGFVILMLSLLLNNLLKWNWKKKMNQKTFWKIKKQNQTKRLYNKKVVEKLHCDMTSGHKSNKIFVINDWSWRASIFIKEKKGLKKLKSTTTLLIPNHQFWVSQINI